MIIKARKIPSYRLHKPTGQAVVRLDGRDFYLGKHGSEGSHEAYRRRIAEWLTHGPVVAPSEPDSSGGGIPLTVNDLILAYWHHAEVYYQSPDGTPSSEPEKIKLALRPLKRIYGSTPARDFGPKALKSVRQVMVDGGLCRRTINQRVALIVRLFRFAVESEFAPASLHHALKAVPGLRSGRSGAKESRTIKPVSSDRVDATLPHLSRQLRAVVELQRLTGMRSGEVLSMRSMDVDTIDDVWEYVPERHKTAHHGKKRRIFLGPRAQEIVRAWLREDPAEYLFQPVEAQREFHSERRKNRKTPLTPSQRARTRKARPRKAPGDRYDSRAYAHAIARACDRAFLHSTLSKVRAKDLSIEQRAELKEWRRLQRWHPHQLRHSAATQLRKEFGLDVARVVLGHTSPAVTETYAEVDREKAVRAMKLIG
ncbi:MAG: Phage integrase family protein [Planctomycetota bacterium]|nr:Phage integrase family protein [Planctomycetota bacterium]